MPYTYLAPWEWHTDEIGFSLWRPPGGNAVGALDLRSLPQMGSGGGGYGAFSYDAPQTIARSIDLGDNPRRRLTAQERIKIGEALAIPGFDSATVLDALWDVLTLHADPTGRIAPKPIRGRFGGTVGLRFEGRTIKEEPFDDAHRQRAILVYQEDYRKGKGKTPDDVLARQTGSMMLNMYGQMSDDLKVTILPEEYVGDGWTPPRTTISDNFNRANNADLGADWTERAGVYSIISNRLQKDSGGATANCAYHNTALSSADYYIQVVSNVSATLQHRGPCGRRTDFSTSDSDFYAALLTSTGTHLDFYKRVSGVWTLLDAQLATYAINTDYTIKIEMDGTTMKSWFDGVAKSNFTDSSISAVGFAGVVNGTVNNDKWDDFIAADLVAGEATDVFFENRHTIERGFKAVTAAGMGGVLIE